MSDGYGPGYAQVHDGGGGCVTLVIVGLLIMFGYMLAGRGSTTPQSVTTTTTSETLSRNEVMSRNQLNLWSDVTNCYGDGSCPTTIITNTTTTVAGDRSPVTVQGGVGDLPMCWDPALSTYTSSACHAGGQP